jgi:DnaJ family protein A protein 5
MHVCVASTGYSDSSQGEDDEEVIECVACDKFFRSEKSCDHRLLPCFHHQHSAVCPHRWESHQKSKKHLKAVADLRAQLKQQDKETATASGSRTIDACVFTSSRYSNVTSEFVVEDEDSEDEAEEQVHADPEPQVTTQRQTQASKPTKADKKKVKAAQKQAKAPKQPQSGKLTAASLRAQSDSDSESDSDPVPTVTKPTKTHEKSESESTSSESDDAEDLCVVPCKYDHVLVC